MTTDTTEKGLETLIMRHMTGGDGLAVPPNQVAERPPPYGGTGYTAGSALDYDRAHALDVPQLFAFLRATQPAAFGKLGMADANDPKDINRIKFLARLSREIGKRGVIDVLRKGIDHGPLHFDLFYGTPSPGNARAVRRHAENRFSITRQLAYSMDGTRRALDLCLFINGLPIATFELKNRLTKQTVEDAVAQYQRDRDPRERLFELENYAQIVSEKDPRTGRQRRRQVWPRYHQLGLVRETLADVRAHGAGRRYLNQHSAGSGKSNSIAWLAHQLIGLTRDGDAAHGLVFDSVIVVTDRRLLDGQIQATIRQFMQVGATVGHAEHSGDLRRFIEQGKKIIVSTVQKFPFILDEIALDAGKTFAIIIDEAHSSQGGKTSAAMSQALGAADRHGAGDGDSGPDPAPDPDPDPDPDPEDTVNAALEQRMAARKLLTNASYFAFTATPKNKTLELFGEPLPPAAEGKVKHRPFHSYTMKQAAMKLALADADAEIAPVPTAAGGRNSEPELDRLSNILDAFNEQFGTLFNDTDRVAKRIRDDIAPKVAADTAYQNAKENTPHTARLAHDQALAKVMQHLLADDTQVYQQFVENESFKRSIEDMVYAITNP